MQAARWLAIAATFAAVSAAGWLLSLTLRRSRGGGADDLRRWMAGLASIGCCLALIAIFYQGVSALLA
jgi:hypothetical protein